MTSKNNSQHSVDFGFQQVTPEEKTTRVKEVFHSVASRYDVMNNVMSFGVHHVWKWIAAHLAQIKPGTRILDIAGGTGDLTRLFLDRVGVDGSVCLLDINAAMLKAGRDRLLDEGYWERLNYLQANAEALPLPNNHFDLISIGFGLRNVTDKTKALREMYRVLKPGGSLLILEFSKPIYEILRTAYDFYSFNLLPLMGRYVADDEASYRYLAESIRCHPDQETLKQLVLKAGFDECEYYNLTGGIVAIHKAYKY